MIKKLLSIRLRGMFIGSVVGRDKKGSASHLSPLKVALFTLLYAFLGLFLLGFAFASAFSIGAIIIPASGGDFYYGIFSVISTTIIFIMSIFETKSELFECKDNELLLSLPIKSIDIVVSRIFSVLSINYIIGILIFVPAIVCFAIFGGGAVGILGGIILMLTLPIFATALSSGVGYVVAYISSKMKNKTFVTLVVSILFLAAYFIVYFGLIEQFESFVDGSLDNIAHILTQYPAINLIGSIAFFSPIPFISYILSAVLITTVSFWAINKNYTYIMTSSRSAAKKKYEAKKLSQTSTFCALVKKEFGRFLSSANYILNSALGVLFAIGITVFIAIERNSIPEYMSMFFDGEIAFPIDSLIAPVLISALIFCLSMNTVSASALSLEGENILILKSMPITSRQILLSKTIPHIIVNATVSVICGLVLAIVTKATPVYYLFYILTPTAVSVLCAFAGILLNVAFPKFEFSNEIQVIKQSLPVFLAIIGYMLLSLAISLASLFAGLFGFGLFASIIILVLVSALDFGLYLIISGPASRRLERL